MARRSPMQPLWSLKLWATNAFDRMRGRRALRRSLAALVAPPPRRFAAFGQGSWIVPPARVEGPEWMEIGSRVVIHEHAWLAARQVDGLPPPSLRIGDDTSINRFVNIVCAGSVRLGDGVLIADRAFISDIDGTPPSLGLRAGQPRPRPITIEDGAYLGAGVIVKPGVTIGRYAYVSAASIVVEDVPEHTLVAGAPARAVRRWDPASEATPGPAHPSTDGA